MRNENYEIERISKPRFAGDTLYYFALGLFIIGKAATDFSVTAELHLPITHRESFLSLYLRLATPKL